MARSPSHRRTAGVCAHRTAGVDVKRTSQTAAFGRLNWAESGRRTNGRKRVGRRRSRAMLEARTPPEGGIHGRPVGPSSRAGCVRSKLAPRTTKVGKRRPFTNGAERVMRSSRPKPINSSRFGLGRDIVLDPNAREMGRMVETRKLAAILIADVAGYSLLTGADEEGTLARLRSLRSDLINPTIGIHNGRVVKRTATVRSSSSAV